MKEYDNYDRTPTLFGYDGQPSKPHQFGPQSDKSTTLKASPLEREIRLYEQDAAKLLETRSLSELIDAKNDGYHIRVNPSVSPTQDCHPTTPTAVSLPPSDDPLPTDSDLEGIPLDQPDPPIDPLPYWCPRLENPCEGCDPGWLYERLQCGCGDSNCQSVLDLLDFNLPAALKQIAASRQQTKTSKDSFAFLLHVATTRRRIHE